MATYLYRLGGWAFRRRRTVLLAWIAVLGLVVASAAAFSGQTNEQVLGARAPSPSRHRTCSSRSSPAPAAPARAWSSPRPRARSSPTRRTRPPSRRRSRRPSRPRASPRSSTPTRPTRSRKDGRIAYADVIYPVPADQIDDPARDELAAAAEPARDAGLQVEFGGGLVTEESKSNSESMGMMIGFVVLAITLGSLLAAGLPLITAILGVLVGVTGLTALTGVFDVSETAPILATMLGLAVGIDYALFILSRHRQNMGDGLEPAGGGRPGHRDRRLRRRLRRHDRRHRPRRPDRGQHPVPHGHGPGRGRHGDDRRAHRAHAAARHPRLRRGPRGPRQPRARLPPAAQAHPARVDGHPLGALRHLAPAGRRCSSASPSSAPWRCPRCT